MVPYAGFSFYCFESVKFLCMKYAPQYTCNKCEKNTGTSWHQEYARADFHSCFCFVQIIGGLVLSIPAKLLSGGLAGAIAQSFSYPLDVTRRRMQLAMMDPATAKFGYLFNRIFFCLWESNGEFFFWIFIELAWSAHFDTFTKKMVSFVVFIVECQ